MSRHSLGGLAATAMLCLSSGALAQQPSLGFKYGQWFGGPINDGKSCQLATTIQKDYALIIRSDGEGSFDIGAFVGSADYTVGEAAAGRLYVDHTPPVELKGSVVDSKSVLLSASHPGIVRTLFTKGSILRVEFSNGSWAQLGLNGSAAAVGKLDECIQRVAASKTTSVARPGMNYAEAREKIIASGDMPFEFPKSGCLNRKVCSVYPEAQICGENGKTQCHFIFQKKNGSVYRVTTVREEENIPGREIGLDLEVDTITALSGIQLPDDGYPKPRPPATAVPLIASVEGLWVLPEGSCDDPNDGYTHITSSAFEQYESSCHYTDAARTKSGVKLSLMCSGEGENWNATADIESLSYGSILIDYMIAGQKGNNRLAYKKCDKLPAGWETDSSKQEEAGEEEAGPKGAGEYIPYGSRIGMNVTVVDRSGIDTEKAVIEVKHTRENAKEFCLEYADDKSEKCILDTLKEEAELASSIVANCKSGVFTDLWKTSVRFNGKVKAKPSENDIQIEYELVVDGEKLDGTSASGYDVRLTQFRSACPARFGL